MPPMAADGGDTRQALVEHVEVVVGGERERVGEQQQARARRVDHRRQDAEGRRAVLGLRELDAVRPQLGARQARGPHAERWAGFDLARRADDLLAGASHDDGRARRLAQLGTEVLDERAVVVRHEHGEQIGPHAVHPRAHARDALLERATRRRRGRERAGEAERRGHGAFQASFSISPSLRQRRISLAANS
jgi:hypothetical protein